MFGDFPRSARACTAAAVVALCPLASAQQCDLELVQVFNPAEGGNINAIAYDQFNDEVIVHFNFSAVEFHVYARDGTFLRTIPKASGVSSNNSDITVSVIDTTINGVLVPAGSLIEFENQTTPPRIVASNPSDGSLIVELPFGGGVTSAWVGGAIAPGTGSFFVVDWVADEIDEVDVTNGSLINTFPVNTGNPGFDIFYGDIEALQADDFIYVISDAQNRIRVFTQDGDLITDLDISQLELGGVPLARMAGIAFDNTRGEAWFGSQNGNVYRVTGFNGITACIGDTNGDKFVDLTDLLTVLANFGLSTDQGASAGDVDGCQTGEVDLTDLLATLANFGQTCP